MCAHMQRDEPWHPDAGRPLSGGGRRTAARLHGEIYVPSQQLETCSCSGRQLS